MSLESQSRLPEVERTTEVSMANRIFKGRLITTGVIHEENQRAFPEASESFGQSNKEGLNPYDILYGILKDVEEAHMNSDDDFLRYHNTPGEKHRVRVIGNSIWVSGDGGHWIKIDLDGSFEIGTSGP
jgi:hypothetical protein